jgi:hypothetical protein
MTLPKITAARPLGSPGVVRSPAAAPGSFEERCRGDRFCRCRGCKPPLGGPSGNLLSSFGSSLLRSLAGSRFDQAQGGR